MRLASLRFIIVPVILLFAGGALFSQQNSEIVGTVTDQTGAAVPGASLTLTQKETGFAYNVTSNSTGGYVFAGLNVGTYNLKVTAKGFEAYTAAGLALNVSQTLAVDVKLTVGAETVEVTVSADALQVQAESNEVSTLISGEQLTSIATANRNFTALAALGLGVSSNLPANNPPSASASSASISVNGLRQSHNIWLLDGAEADDRGGAGGMSVMPSMDAIAQFQVLASNYPPDYGISSGATFSLALKSGTQQLHGEAWEFVRNDAFDANDYFNKYQHGDTPIPVPKLRQNIYGFNLGGPVFIPHVYNTARQKTFFFYNQEWRRVDQTNAPGTNPTIPDLDRPVAGQDLQYVAPAYASSQVIYIPTAAQVPDPAFAARLQAAGLGGNRGQPFPNQIIPASLIDPNAVLYFGSSILPKVNTAGDKATTEEATPTTVTEEIVRIDHKINDKWQILGHYLHDSQATGFADADLGWNWETYNTITSVESNPSNSAAIKLTAALSPELLVEASMNYDGNVINITNSPNTLLPSGWTPNTFFTNSGSNQFVGVNWCGNGVCSSMSTGYGPWHNAAQDYQPRLDISYTKGKHAMKFGWSYMRYTKNQQLQADAAGDYGFGQNQTGTGAGGNAGDPFMSMVLGLAGSYSQPQSMSLRYYVNNTVSAYVNDNWKVSPRLSLQVGLRYDALPHAWERHNDLTNFEPSQYIAAPVDWSTQFPGAIEATSAGVQTPAGFGGASYYLNGMVIPGTNGVPHGAVTNDYNTLQPRVGFSYDLTGSGKTILRGGFGVFYERLQGNDIYGLSNSNLPFEYTPNAGSVYFSNPTCSWESTASTAIPGNCGSVTSLPIYPANLTTLDTTYKAPGTSMFSLGIQHQLEPSMIMVVQYVGNLAWHQNIDVPINNFPLTTPNDIRQETASGTLPGSVYPAGSNELRTYAGYGTINQEENTTGYTYNGVQGSLRLQNKWGLSGELDYTYSHNIDITDTDLQTIANPWYLKYEKGNSGYDRRHMFGGNYIYSLPVFNKSQGLAHSLLGGWQIAGTVAWQTGEPVAPGFSGVNDPIGLGGGYTNYPDVINKIHYHHKVNDWFDTYNNGGVASIDQDPLAPPAPGYAGGANLGFGNGRKDTFTGPGTVNFTTSVYKTFAMTERAHFEFRAESFNTFNHTEFSTINTTWTNSTGGQYGTVTGDLGPRLLELGGKLVF
ncbi:MAG TPA: carboxypeptidase-like regulatory domain-containing protein [Terracidiphilus sp.]|nr:carboxypeptidase-like regulatory domain-containing protein [Terracidiphilus sp.]